MSTESSPMVPGTHWGQMADDFGKSIPKPELLCVPCYVRGVTTPAKFVYDGSSMCEACLCLHGRWNSNG